MFMNSCPMSNGRKIGSCQFIFRILFTVLRHSLLDIGVKIRARWNCVSQNLSTSFGHDTVISKFAFFNSLMNLDIGLWFFVMIKLCIVWSLRIGLILYSIFIFFNDMGVKSC